MPLIAECGNGLLGLLPLRERGMPVLLPLGMDHDGTAADDAGGLNRAQERVLQQARAEPLPFFA